jgi:hypothetical protein
MDYYQQFPYQQQQLPQQPEIDYRQQGQFFPGGGGGGFNQQINRLERQIERLDRRMDQLDRRVDRIERRLGLRQEEY